MTDQGDRVLKLNQYSGIIRRRWRYAAFIIPPVILSAIALAFLLPAIYSSSATILLEASSIDPSLVKTTVVSYADQQIELVRREVMSGKRLEELVKQVDPYPQKAGFSVGDKAALLSSDTTLQKVDPVTLEPLVVSSAFTIKYRNRSPQIAAAIAQRLADLFLTANREARTAEALDVYNFMLAKSRELDAQIKVVDQHIAEFKSRYGDVLPEVTGRNESGLDRAQSDIEATKAQVLLVEQQESLLKLQLDQISPTIITAKGSDLFTQLGTLRAQLAEAQQKYTPDHPDVKRLKRAIEALAEQAKLGNPQNIVPDNPDYLRVSAELRGVRETLAALRAKIAHSESQVDQFSARLAATPRVEQDYMQLTRAREDLQRQIEATQEKLRGADMSRSLESQSKGERYTLIRKPGIPTKPESPNRLGIVLLGFVLGFGLAGGLMAFKEATDPAVRSNYDVADITDLPVIAAIPTLVSMHERRQQRYRWGALAGGYAVAMLVVAWLIIVVAKTWQS